MKATTKKTIQWILLAPAFLVFPLFLGGGLALGFELAQAITSRDFAGYSRTDVLDLALMVGTVGGVVACAVVLAGTGRHLRDGQAAVILGFWLVAGILSWVVYLSMTVRDVITDTDRETSAIFSQLLALMLLPVGVEVYNFIQLLRAKRVEGP